MGLVRRRPAAVGAIITAIIAVSMSSVTLGSALAATSTITRQDCAQGRIRDKSGTPISQARCEALVGRSIELASTGFDDWIVALGGLVFIGGGVLLWRRPRPVRI